MGEIEVPADALWRAQTQRAVENFPISGTTLEPAHIVAMARVKRPRRAGQRRARHHRAGAGGRDRRGAPTRSSAGEHHDAFPIDVFQTGSGTSSNMNMNEVLASPRRPGRRRGPPQRPRQRQPVQQRHLPHLDPRRRGRGHHPRPACPRSTTSPAPWRRKAEEFADVVKSGRTHLMDATPVMLGQEFGGYAAIVRLAVERLESDAPPGAPSCPWAAPPSAPASTPPTGSPPR